MDLSVALSLGWALALAGLFGVGLYRRWRRRTLPLVGTALFVTALATACAIAAVRLQIDGPELRRLLLGISWGAFTAAAVLYSLALPDP